MSKITSEFTSDSLSETLSEVTLSSVFGPPCTRDAALTDLKKDPETYMKFLTFPPEEQEKVMAFLTGQHGLKITYDSFFQKIMSPILHPERLESLLSELLEQPVQIERVLPREGVRLSYEASLIIMDILVQLSDGSRVNVEIQKIGLRFPGERSSCYAADAIMRQYTELKSILKDKFDYRKMRPFYLIILMEESSRPFKEVAPHYIHTQVVHYDSGAKVTSLPQIRYISLDTFRETVHNIDNKLSAWLTFFSSDKPADILKLIDSYPEFRELYAEIAEFRKNPKELIGMYSEALTIADNNTVKLMIDDMRDEIIAQANLIAAKNDELAAKDNELAAKDNELAAKDNELAAKDDELAARDNLIAQLMKELETQKSCT